MELKFNGSQQEFLALQVGQTICHEETAEAIVPDSYPDVEQLLLCHGIATVRNWDYQNGNWVINGGVTAWALYSPQDYDTPKTLQYYIPFTVKCPCPEGEGSQAVVDCRVGAIDGQIINSRKVLVRVTTVTDCYVYKTEMQEQHTYCSESEGALEIQQTTYPLIQPVEVGQKTFTISEEMDLTGGVPSIASICQYHCRMETVEMKLVGNKGVFKGLLHGVLLYETPEETLNTWTFQVPFSQYVELTKDHDDQEMAVQLVFSNLQIEPQGQGVSLSAEVMAQATIMGHSTLEAIEDAYSTMYQFVPQWKMAETTSRVDCQHMTQVARALHSCPAKVVLATQAYVGSPKLERREGMAEITVPLSINVLWEDERGELGGQTVKLDALFETEMANPCQCKLAAYLSGEAFAIPAGDGMEVRCAVGLDIETWVSQAIPMLVGGELGESLDKSQYPSLILRHVEPGDTLWSVAKTCRTTMGEIATANNLGSLDEALSDMILIPVK